MGIKIVFFGTPEFAVASLDKLVKARCDIAAVVTAPDKPSGRGMSLSPSAVKRYAISNNLKLFQPESLLDENFLDRLRLLNAGLQIVVAFRMLPEIVWKMPPLGTFNLHASLLPMYRGAAPINRAIMNGEKETGVTTFFLRKEMDAGKIIFQEKVVLGENETAGELYDRLMLTGADLVLKTIRTIENGEVALVEQSQFYKSESELVMAPKIFKADCHIDWNQNASMIYNQIRGLCPYPAAYTEFCHENGDLQALKVFCSGKEIVSHSESPGKIISDGKSYVKIAVIDGFLTLEEVQLAGKKRMKIDEFLRGFRITHYVKAV